MKVFFVIESKNRDGKLIGLYFTGENLLDETDVFDFDIQKAKRYKTIAEAESDLRLFKLTNCEVVEKEELDA